MRVSCHDMDTIKHFIKVIFATLITLFVIFLILDLTGLTGWLLYPYTRATKGAAAAGDTTT